MSDPSGTGGSGRSGGNGGSTDQTVTTVVSRTVKPNRRADYEAWLHRLLTGAETVDGYAGAEVHPPAPGAEPAVYTSVFRFDTLAQLRAFEAGDLRRQMMDEVADLVEADAVWRTHTGLELWFDPPPGTVVPQPVRWRMALLLGLVVYALVLVFGAVAAATIGWLPFPVRLALVIAVEITLMTYVILPWLTRRLARWIYPTAETVT
ncbi:MAG: antibiotic biosynthesis monooxygenase [Actinomycetota bacterium]